MTSAAPPTRRLTPARTAAVVLVFSTLAPAGRPSWAQAHDAGDGAETACRMADEDEDRLAFTEAMAHDRACVLALAGTRWAARASERIGWLQARSEDGFAPLAHLERVRRNPKLSDDPAAIEALGRAADGFPPGTVRVEARMLVAEAWLGRLGRPLEAIGELRKVTDDPAADPLTASLAEREIVEALEESGAIDAAAREARAHASRLDARFLSSIERRARRRWLQAASATALTAFAGMAASALWRAHRRRALVGAARALRRIAPVATALSAFLALAGSTLAGLYESGSGTPFLLLGAAVLPLLLVARAWGAVGSSAAPARTARAVLCAAAVLAAAFTLLDVVSPVYLESFDL